MKLFFYLIILSSCFVLTQRSFANYSTAKDGEYVTISGKITKVSADMIHLKSKGEVIPVEVDDYDLTAEGYNFKKGDKVVVTGKIDKDFLEKKKVEAGSVFVKELNAYFYANSDDEEDFPHLNASYYSLELIPENTSLDIQGRVIAVSGREFTVDTGVRIIKVDTSEMNFNPMDNKGFIQIDVNDRVRVSGIVESSLFNQKEISASYITELSSKSLNKTSQL